MSQVKSVYQYEEYKTASLTHSDSQENRFESCEEIVDAIVSKGLLNSQNPSSSIAKVAKEYNLSYEEAKTCVRLANAQNGVCKENKPEDKLYAQSGYFYPASQQSSNFKNKNDGMDSLSSFASYNKLMFGIR